MKRYRMVIQYDGTEYFGFQVQPLDRSVQGVLEELLQRLTQHPVKVVGAGRTDSGVHAQGQVVHFDAALTIPISRLPAALNSMLPRDLRVRYADEPDPEFHARYGAVAKTYCYQVWQGPYADVFWRRFALWMKHPLDWTAAAAAGAVLQGTHDFAGFAAAGGSVKTTVRTLHRVRVCHEGALTKLFFTADGFLYNMVRNVTGTLLEVAQGRRNPADVRSILAGGDRRLAGATAPAHGLTLLYVIYPDLRSDLCAKPQASDLLLDTEPGVQ